MIVKITSGFSFSILVITMHICRHYEEYDYNYKNVWICDWNYNELIPNKTSEKCQKGQYTDSDGACKPCTEGVRDVDMNQLHGCQACKDPEPCPVDGTYCRALARGEVCETRVIDSGPL